ncbi:nucleotide-binding universal stress UspA family protein [Frondihabitans sp. PhB188]|uniref:universal stress protein n=1 Tax=Frondihabitans sp. PhB188 TaxID=2485200 RepID=UPI000F48D397|nr:universal stress protein [Frondihabitans sp. PhB188]ROQ30909.1 nucleotide-binding universal stress UspA family protein [Frondihabitans sp. PhB188]
MTTPAHSAVIVVGLQPGFAPGIVRTAAEFAHRFHASLLCVTVDASLLSLGKRADGSEMIEPLDPDTADSTPRGLSDDETDAVRTIAGENRVPVDFLLRAGMPARALAAVAEDHDAGLIVVGTDSGRQRIGEFFNGSVAARLAHQQHRPVVVVPSNPVGLDDPLPWDAS